MLKKNRPQLDVFDHIIFEKLVPKDHLLVKIDSIIDFLFIYDLVKEQYSPIDRGSIDPVMLVKIFLLEYLYRLSDVEVVKRIQTDVVFRWFLNLGINDSVPDDTTLSFFRIQRLTEEHKDGFFVIPSTKKCENLTKYTETKVSTSAYFVRFSKPLIINWLARLIFGFEYANIHSRFMKSCFLMAVFRRFHRHRI